MYLHFQEMVTLNDLVHGKYCKWMRYFMKYQLLLKYLSINSYCMHYKNGFKQTNSPC